MCNENFYIKQLIKEAKIAQYKAAVYQKLFSHLQSKLWPFKEELVISLEKSLKADIKRVLEKESRTLNFNQIPSKIN